MFYASIIFVTPVKESVALLLCSLKHISGKTVHAFPDTVYEAWTLHTIAYNALAEGNKPKRI
jgi:hypothetical protein